MGLFCCDCSQPLMALKSRGDTHQMCRLLKVKAAERRAGNSHRLFRTIQVRLWDSPATVMAS
jgi:hypothetical protein